MSFSYDLKIDNLTKRLQNFEEKRMLETSVLDLSSNELEATINELTQKLKKSKDANTNLQTYIDHLKISYQTVFGNDASHSSAPSSLSISTKVV